MDSFVDTGTYSTLCSEEALLWTSVQLIFFYIDTAQHGGNLSLDQQTQI